MQQEGCAKPYIAEVLACVPLAYRAQLLGVCNQIRVRYFADEHDVESVDDAEVEKYALQRMVASVPGGPSLQYRILCDFFMKDAVRSSLFPTLHGGDFNRLADQLQTEPLAIPKLDEITREKWTSFWKHVSNSRDVKELQATSINAWRVSAAFDRDAFCAFLVDFGTQTRFVLHSYRKGNGLTFVAPNNAIPGYSMLITNWWCNEGEGHASGYTFQEGVEEADEEELACFGFHLVFK